MGLRVIAVVRGSDPQKVADAQRAGAEVVLNSDRDDVTSAVLAHTEGQGVRGMVDVDLGAHLGFAARIVAVNGCIASFGTASNPRPVLDWTPFMNRNIRVCGVGIFSVPEAHKLAIVHHVQSALQAQQLWHRVDRRFALDDFAEAHRHQAHGHPHGKIIVTL
jgi:NADPH:quinone reductase-like Zn-dependent oxidoreductase